MITATKETPAADEAYITENRLVEYTITVTNSGTEKGNATVTDVIDSRLEYKQSELGNKYDKDSISYDKTTKTVTWNVVDLPAGESRTATITVWVGEITNGVSETIPNIVNVDGKPTDEETITVGKPSIKTEKTSEILECSKGIKEGTIVHEGDVIKYTIKVKNEGTLPKKISVTDTIKSGLTYVEGTLSVDRANTGASITNGVLTITDYELSEGQEMTITFNVRVNELTDADYSKDKDGNIIYSKKIDANVASVDGKSPSDDKEYEVIKPVINVKKEVSKTVVSVNEEFYYDITVTNVGTDVGNTVITDTIPSELIYNGFVKPTNDDVVTYDETTRLLTWNVNALKVKESRTLRINVKTPADVTVNPTTVTNSVYKDGSEKPEDSVDTKVAKPVITTTKSSEVTECKFNLTTEDTIGKKATTVHEGDVIKYTITITNSGEVAGIVNMNDSLPAGMTFKGSLTTSLSNVNVVVANDKKSISLSNYSLAGNTTLTITFEVTIDNLGTVKDKDEIERLKKNIQKSKSMKKEYGAKPILGGILFLIYGNEVLSLFGGSKKELMSFQSAYTLHFEGIKYAIENGYDTYNFYGITGDFSKDNPLLGLYLFKKSFGGQVVELIGEFDLIISKFWYHTYNISFKLYHKLKKLKNHK